MASLIASISSCFTSGLIELNTARSESPTSLTCFAAAILTAPVVPSIRNGPSIFSDDARDMNALKKRIIDNLRAYITISPSVELHEPGVLPIQEGKAIRVVDERGE